VTANKGNGFTARANDHMTTAHLEQAIEVEQKSLTTAHLEQKITVSSSTQGQAQGQRSSGGASNSGSEQSGSSNQG